MKHNTYKIRSYILGLVVIFSQLFFLIEGSAQVVVTMASNSPVTLDTCGAFPTGFFPIGDIAITEQNTVSGKTDIGVSQVNVTFVLTAPDSFQFQPGTGTLSARLVGGGLGTSITFGAGAIVVTATTIRITFSTDAITTNQDSLTISNINMRGIKGPRALSNIIRKSGSGPGGSANINGDAAGGGVSHGSVISQLLPSVGTPSAITISAGAQPTCQLTNGTTTTTYATTATNSTGFNWSLSTTAAGVINSSTGLMTWANGFSGSVDIRVTATGCGGPSSQTTRTVTVTPNVGTPTTITVSSGTQPTCKLTNGTTTTTYATTATNSTGFNWSLSSASAGVIGATTGLMTWANNFSGTVDIQVTANGCSGPSTQTIRTVNITSTVGTPTAITISSGTEPTCQLTNGSSTTTYATTATNSTGFNWSLSNGSAGSINAAGVMTWTNGFSGSVDIRVTASGCNGPSSQEIRTVAVTPTVGTPTTVTFPSGTEPSCQLINGTTSTAYATTASNSTGFNWSLSTTAAGVINSSTGVMTWTNGFFGSVSIRVTANGCNGPSAQTTRPVTITPTVGTPTTITVSAGTEPTCKLTNGTTTTTYATTATNSTGFIWSLSTSAAGVINTTSGLMTWANNFAGTVDIRVTANGCNGPSGQVIRTVNITQTVGNPTAITILTGTQPTCQLTNATTSTTYTTTSTNSTGFNWSLSNAAAGSIDPITGVMTWANLFSGTVDIRVTANGCNGPSAQTIRTVVVNPKPNAIAGIDTTYCSGNSVQLGTSLPEPNVNYQWTPSTGLNNAAIANPFVSLTNSTTVFILQGYILSTVNSVTGCVNADTVLVTINPIPTITNIINDTVCEGATVPIPFTPQVANVNFNWTNSNTNAVLSGTSSGTSATGISFGTNNTSVDSIASVFTVTPVFTNNNVACSGTADLVKIVVNPTPTIIHTPNDTVCEGSQVNINFNPQFPRTDFHWTNSNPNAVLSVNPSGSTSTNISFGTNNTTTDTISSFFTVTPVFTLGTKTCSGTQDQFKIIVNPIPTINSIDNDTVCEGTPVSIPFNPQLTNVNFNWTNSNVNAVISGSSGTSSTGIAFATNNNSSDSISSFFTATPVFTLGTKTCLGTQETFTITVKPRPIFTNSSFIDSICSGSLLNDTLQADFTNNVVYSWSFVPNSQISGATTVNNSANFIIMDTLINVTNNSFQTIVYNLALTFDVNSSLTCFSNAALTVVVKPAPATPSVISHSNDINGNAFALPSRLCGGTEYYSFNVNPPQPNIIYHWDVQPPTSNTLDDLYADNPNTVISFDPNTNPIITLTAFNDPTLGKCPNKSFSFTVQVLDGNPIEEKEDIRLKQPGNLLIYPDQSVDGYRWGYDSVVGHKPHFISGQVYQAFIPSAFFLKDGVLNETDFEFWVMVYKQSGTELCTSKIYYNGPLAGKKIPVEKIPDEIIVTIIPNPNNGVFNLQVQGDIYGGIETKIFNVLGQCEYINSIDKSNANQTFAMDVNHLAPGLYFMELIDYSGEPVITKLIIK